MSIDVCLIGSRGWYVPTDYIIWLPKNFGQPDYVSNGDAGGMQVKCMRGQTKVFP